MTQPVNDILRYNIHLHKIENWLFCLLFCLVFFLVFSLILSIDILLANLFAIDFAILFAILLAIINRTLFINIGIITRQENSHQSYGLIFKPF